MELLLSNGWRYKALKVELMPSLVSVSSSLLSLSVSLFAGGKVDGNGGVDRAQGSRASRHQGIRAGPS